MTKAEEVLAARISKLDRALRELEGFAQRNLERAKIAYESGKKTYHPIAEADDLASLEGQYHQAQRFYDVVRDRVKEALAAAPADHFEGKPVQP